MALRGAVSKPGQSAKAPQYAPVDDVQYVTVQLIRCSKTSALLF